jgi:hypothetical protein
MSPTDERYDSNQIANMLGVLVKTLYDHRWRESAGLSKILWKNGKRIYAWKKEFDRWFASERVACV